MVGSFFTLQNLVEMWQCGMTCPPQSGPIQRHDNPHKYVHYMMTLLAPGDTRSVRYG